MIVRDANGAPLGSVLPVNGRWAWWRGAAPTQLRWAETKKGAIAALLSTYETPATPAASRKGRDPVNHETAAGRAGAARGSSLATERRES